ncbi:nuclease-related domain-containing protein [Streptomyces sp. WAC 04229]|uniref:nuclease-related domain-containing protein n=1 Tax=Streptomyces sp. WAC 04229 TaxID=2203206 RepID=UPI00163CCC86|nr:NERD domain-containing protein [Streptomyces sp. WAC 04229]
MTAGGSTSREAARLRAAARRGWWRTVLRWCGVHSVDRRLEAAAVRQEQGSLGEQWTAELLTRLPAGWQVFHDLAVPGRRFNVDHVAIPPSGDGLVVLDSKKWRKSWEGRPCPTVLLRGRVHCGRQDRHEQVEKFAGYVSGTAAALGVPAGMLLPVIVVHGSPVAGGRLDVPVPAWERMVHVLAADRLLATLVGMPGGMGPVQPRAVDLAARVRRTLPRYGSAA